MVSDEQRAGTGEALQNNVTGVRPQDGASFGSEAGTLLVQLGSQEKNPLETARHSLFYHGHNRIVPAITKRQYSG